MDNVLKGKIVLLDLIPIDKNAYNKYLKPHVKAYKKAEVDVNRFKYYKLYSIEYLERTSTKELLERDREKQQCLVKTDERI